MPTTDKKRTSNKPTSDSKRSFFAALGSLGALLSIVAAISIAARLQATGPVTSADDIAGFDQIVSEDTDSPDENNPDVDTVEYNVPDVMPRRIIVSDLGINGFVQQVGITSEHAIAVPSNIHIGGWYTQSELPGQPGLSIIDGHVSGRYSDGIFKDLGLASIGMEFQIEYGDRSLQSFRVLDVVQVSEAESAETLFSKRAGVESQLNLITCGGEFDSSTDSYEDRIVLLSEAIGAN